MTLFTRHLGAAVLTAAWILSVPQGTFSQRMNPINGIAGCCACAPAASGHAAINILNQRINLLVQQFATIGRLAKTNGHTRILAAHQPLVGFAVSEKSVGLAHVDFRRLLFLLLGG